MEFDTIVVRESMLGENYGAYLWNLHHGIELLKTEPITKMDDDLLDKIEGKHILIVGGYYRNNMEPILKAAKTVKVFDSTTGFLTWTVEQLEIKDETILTMARYIDNYQYGYPSEEALCFQNGVYCIDKDTDLDKILTIKSLDDINLVLINGKTKRISNLRLAEQRLKCSKQLSLKIEDQTYNVLVGIGDSPVVDTCLLLANKSSNGIGMLFRYDLLNNKTFISTRTTEMSEVNAGVLMKKLIGGDGTKSMGGGSIQGLFFPEQLFSS